MDGRRRIEFPKGDIMKNPLLTRNEFFEGPTMKLTEEQIQKKLRGFAGASLWVTQARFDVAYMVGMLGTKVIPSSRFAEVLKEFIALS